MVSSSGRSFFIAPSAANRRGKRWQEEKGVGVLQYFRLGAKFGIITGCSTSLVAAARNSA